MEKVEAPVGKNDLLPVGFQLLQDPFELLPRFDLHPGSLHSNLLTPDPTGARFARVPGSIRAAGFRGCRKSSRSHTGWVW